MTADSQPEPLAVNQKRTTFAGDVARLVTGTTIAWAVVILASPLLTRLYTPESFGLLALFTSITGILGAVACLRYESAIMLPRTDAEAANLLAVSLLFPLLVALAAAAVLAVAAGPLLAALNAPELSPYLWLAPVSVFISGVFAALNYWNSRTRHFTRLSVARVGSAATTASATLGFGYAGHATSGTLIGASVGGQAVATAVLGGQILRDDHRVFRHAIRAREMLAGMKRYRDFPRYSTWAALLDNLALQLPTLLLAAFFSPAVVGFYALGHRVLSMPMSLVGSAIGQVFFQRAAQGRHDGTLTTVVVAVFRRLVVFSICPFLLLILIGPDVFALVFGPGWREAGLYASILAPWTMVMLVSSPLSPLLAVLERQRTGLLFHAALISSRVVSLLIGGNVESVVIALTLCAASGAAIGLWKLIYTLNLVGISVSQVLLQIARTLLLAVMFISPALALRLAAVATPHTIILVGGLGVTLYYLFMGARDPQIVAVVRRIRALRTGA